MLSTIRTARLIMVGLSIMISPAYATDGLPLSAFFGTAASCDDFLLGGSTLPKGNRRSLQEYLLVTPDKIVGDNLTCTAEGSSRSDFLCMQDGHVRPSTITLSDTGAGTLSVTLFGQRVVLDKCALKSEHIDMFTVSLSGRSALVFSGKIDKSDVAVFAQKLKNSQVELVILDSPGGEINAAMEIGNELRRHDIDTMVQSGQICASACSLIFFAGKKKFLSRSAAIGLHQAHDGHGNKRELATARMDGYLSALGLPRSTLAPMYDYGPNDMMWLSDQERNKLGIISLWP